MYGDELRRCRDMQLAILGHILIEQYGIEALDMLTQWSNERTLKKWQRIAKYANRTDPDYLQCLFSEKAHVYKIIRNTQSILEVKVTKCIHADTFKRLNAAHIGERLICSSDAPATEGFNPLLHLHRPQVLMKGDDCCHFIWELVSDQPCNPKSE